MNPSVFYNRKGELLDSTFHPGKFDNFLLVLGHGVTGNKDRPLLVALAERLSACGYPSLRISFSGNGHSGGGFADSNISQGVQDLNDLIASLPDATTIVYCGHSMGGATGVLATSENPRIKALISLAGMVHTKEFCSREFGEVVPGEGSMWDDSEFPLSQKYVDDLNSIGDTLTAVKKLNLPYLLIHGTADDVVPPQDSKDAYSCAQEPKRIVLLDRAEHSFGEEFYDQIAKEIADWVKQVISEKDAEALTV